MAKKPIKITEVVLRDAHQSLLATRMTMDEMRPILPEMDKIPYFSVECWGGATFDSCIRFLDEDPWERLRILRKELPHQKLQMLFRGQCRCCSAARTCWATAPTPMMLLSTLCRSLLQTASMSSASSTH